MTISKRSSPGRCGQFQNQANSGLIRPLGDVSNQIRDSSVVFLHSESSMQIFKTNFNRGNLLQSKQEENNFKPRSDYRPPCHQPKLARPAPQTHGVSKTDFERYVTANDAVFYFRSELFLLTLLPTKEDLKGVLKKSTTRSGVTIQGPKAVNHDTEVTKDTMPPANNGSTKDVQPPVVQIQSRNPNPEPNVAPVVTPIPKASIPFPSRRNDERRKEKANDQIEKFLLKFFRDLSSEITLPTMP
ncbi:hypothetical protein Tco_1215380 [Tanacetum coccineum]